MKRKGLIVFAIVAMLFAYAQGVAAKESEFYTLITQRDGETVRSEGVIRADAIEDTKAEKIASYAVFSGEEKLFEVKLNDIISKNTAQIFAEEGTPIVNGYYSVRFTLSQEDNTEAFLTGLSDTNLELVQEKIINANLSHSALFIESFDFIDTEKTDVSGDGDDELCWAASTSDILVYSGWAAKAGFKNADELFDLFNKSFTDAGGHPYYGLPWFFDGSYHPQVWYSWSQVTDYGESGGYLKEYDIHSNMRYINPANDHEKLYEAMSLLEEGYGLGMSVGWVDDDDNRNGGHAISAWGYICDKDFEPSDVAYYTNIIVSDSDSDMPLSLNRRVAPNKLRVLSMTPYKSEKYDTWRLDGYADGVMDGFVCLAPYSDTIEYEKESGAALDRANVCDATFAQEQGMTYDKDLKDLSLRTFSDAFDIYFIPRMVNYSEVNLTESFKISVTVKNKSGEVVFEKHDYEYTEDVPSFANGVDLSVEGICIGRLQTGEYTLYAEANPERTMAEAYFYNNTCSVDFTVLPAAYSGVMSADIGEFDKDGAKTQLHYENIDNVAAFEGKIVNFALLASYYDGESWSAYEMVARGDDAIEYGELSANLPAECTVAAYGEKVRLKLIVCDAEKSLAVLEAQSAAYDLRYAAVESCISELNSGEYTSLDMGAKALKDGEVFAFTAVDVSPCDMGEGEYDAVVYAVNGDEKTELYRKEAISLGFLQESEDIVVREWSADLAGTYDIVACIEGGCQSDELFLGTLSVREKPSYTVTTANDVLDDYDGKISLREAVGYMKEGACDEAAITFDVSSVMLTEVIVIDSAITIDGTLKDGNKIDGTLIQGSNTQLFTVTADGVLNMKSVAPIFGQSIDCGGALENIGGSVTLEKCRFFRNSSGTSGGAVYTMGGTLTLKNCTFKMNTSGYGGAIGADGGAIVNILNNDFFLNSSNCGAIYNNRANIVAVYTTFNDNTLTSQGGGAVTSIGETVLVGCIAAGNGKVDLSGSVASYGSFIEKSGSEVFCDALSQQGEAKSLFLYDGAAALWDITGVANTLFYTPTLSEKITDGVFVRNDGGKISISADNETWVTTPIDSAFDDGEYAADKLGDAHGALFGSYATVAENAQIVNAQDGSVTLFMPREREAALIITQDGEIVKTYADTYGAGTVDVETSTEGNKAMLWDSCENLIPLCEAHSYSK